MPWGVAAAAVGGALVSGYASNRAASTQADAAENASNNSTAAANRAADLQFQAATNAQNLQQQNFDRIQEYQQPYRQAGQWALNDLQNQLAQGSLGSGQFKQFNAQDLQKGLAPNYDFMLNQGQMGLERSSAIGSGLVSGNALQAISRFNQDYAGNAYQQAFNNYNTNQQNTYNRLYSLAGLGQNAASNVGNASSNAATAMGNAGMSAAAGAGSALMGGANAAGGFSTSGAAAQAAGYVGGANALSNGLNNYLGWNYLNNTSSGAPQGNYNSGVYTQPGGLMASQ